MWSALVNLMSKFLTFFYNLTVNMGFPSYGWAIILFTVVVRLLLFPLNLKQAKAMKVQQILQPRVTQLQQQYKNSPEILNREMMALYKKYKANPMSGCLPLLIQMPILFALFNCLREYQFDQVGTSFFWLPNMNNPDPTWILPILVAGSSYLQSKVSMAAQPPQAGQMQSMQVTMLYVMPLMLGFMTRNFSAGLVLYWTAHNSMGFLMQIVTNYIVKNSHEDIKKEIEDDQLREELERAERAKVKAKAKAEGKARREAQPRTQPKKNNKKQGPEDDRGKPLDFDDFE